jgi:hypothetical protein
MILDLTHRQATLAGLELVRNDPETHPINRNPRLDMDQCLRQLVYDRCQVILVGSRSVGSGALEYPAIH